MKLQQAIRYYGDNQMPGELLTLARYDDQWFRTAYNDGCVEANHPVPAIRVIVDIEPDRVILWDWTNDCMIYMGE